MTRTKTPIIMRHFVSVDARGRLKYPWERMRPGSEVWVPIVRSDSQAVPTRYQRYKAQSRTMTAWLNKRSNNEHMAHWVIVSTLRYRHVKLVREA